MNGIVTLPKQVLAVRDPAGERPVEAGSPRTSGDSRAGFDGHLADLRQADLVQEEAQRNEPDMSNRDFAACSQGFAPRSFLPAPVRRAESKSHRPVLTVKEQRKARPEEYASASAAKGGRRLGSGVEAAATPTAPATALSIRGMPAGLDEAIPSARSSRPGKQEAEAAPPAGNSVGPAAAVLSPQPRSHAAVEAPSSPGRTGPAGLCVLPGQQARSAGRALPVDRPRLQLRDTGLAASCGSARNSDLAAPAGGEVRPMSKQDLPSLNPQDDNCSLCFAEDQAPETEDKELPPATAQSFAPTRARFPAAEGSGPAQIAFGAFDPEEGAVSPDRSRDLKTAAPASAAITTIDQETHLPPARVWAPSQTPSLLAPGSGFEALRAPGGDGPPASPPDRTLNNVGACGVRENDFTRPALHGFGGRFAPLPRNEAGRLMHMQKGGSELAAFGGSCRACRRGRGRYRCRQKRALRQKHLLLIWAFPFVWSRRRPGASGRKLRTGPRPRA